jgi:4-diphosphocytidyl-2-C-methyl-D-erythritol kinase
MLEVRAHAKINWALRVTGRRADGYHDLETLFQTISLHDTLVFREAEELSLTCDDPTLPVGEANLVISAAREVGALNVAVELRKRIPHGGGLGGGSSDAAATLMALASGRDDLAEIALRLGSDVPFFLAGGTAYGTGRGEVLTALPRVTGVPLALVFPDARMPTARAFGLLRRFTPPLGLAAFREMAEGDLLASANALTNDFEEPVLALLPELPAIKERLLESGAAWAGMSGSGSTMVGAYRDAAARNAALSAMLDAGLRVLAAETI